MEELLIMQRRLRSGQLSGWALRMNRYLPLAVVLALVASGPGHSPLYAAEAEGVALAIVYDTSGSMKEVVPEKTGQKAPKYVIANRALEEVATRIQAFATNQAAGKPHKVDVALFVFQGERSREAIKMGPFDAGALCEFARHFSNPNGNTPLGNALNAAGRAVLDSPLPRKHVLIITDGMNTAGPPPASVMPALKRQADRKGTSLSVHFIAFDVTAKVFEPIKQQGATVVEAADENQLNSQLQFILQRKILLEEEEPPKQQ